jgi:hypothetical protein
MQSYQVYCSLVVIRSAGEPPCRGEVCPRANEMCFAGTQSPSSLHCPVAHKPCWRPRARFTGWGKQCYDSGNFPRTMCHHGRRGADVASLPSRGQDEENAGGRGPGPGAPRR